MAELRVEGTVLFPGAVAPPEPVYTQLAVLTNPNDSTDEVTLYTSDQDSNTYILGQDGVSYIQVTGPGGAAVDAFTTMGDLAGMDGTVLFPGAVPPPVYTQLAVLTNPNTDPNDLLPDTVTLYTSDQDSDTYLLEPDSGTYVRVTDALGVPATGATPMDELQIAGPYGQPIVLFPGAVAPPVYTQLAVLTNPNPDPGSDPASVTLYESRSGR